MTNKLVSVIIPVYNAEDFVARTIRSVLNQTYRELEIIIIDDGSPDRSINVCQQFDDSRIKIVRQKNRGLAGARNTGIRHASGSYIALIDADDLWTPNKIKEHVQHFETSPTVGVSFSYSQFIDERDRPTGLNQIPRKIRNLTAPYILCRNPIGNGSAPVFRTEVFKDIAFEDNLHGETELFYFNEKFKRAEDVECWLRIAVTTSWACEGIPKLLTLYRINSGGLSADAMVQYEYLEKIVNEYTTDYPDIFENSASLALAYFQRYIARRAISSRSAKLAVQMAHRALSSDHRIFTEEPKRTLITLAAAYFLYLVPTRLYEQLEQTALRLISASAKSKRVTEAQANAEA